MACYGAARLLYISPYGDARRSAALKVFSGDGQKKKIKKNET